MQQNNAATHQMMGYDRSSMFSPDGRLLQVEYAKKTVKQGTSIIGISCKEGVMLLADRRTLDKLMVIDSVEKVFQIDDHIAAAAAGIVSDGRILIEKSQLLAQQHRVTYDSSIDVSSLVKEICNLKQSYTQFGGARPFGVSLLVIGVDSKPKLFLTDPTGIHWEYKATAIGESEDELKEILAKSYKENISLDEATKLALTSLKAVLGKNFSLDRLDGGYIKLNEKRFTKISKDYLKKCIKK